MATRFDDWEGPFLEHYGVLGMKWGVRKNRELAYEKASKKMKKLTQNRTKSELQKTKANLRMQRALAKQGKVENKRVGPDDPDYGSYKKKSDKAYAASTKAQKAYEKANFKATKASYREQKWEQSMLKAFGATTYRELESKYSNRVSAGQASVDNMLKNSKRG